VQRQPGLVSATLAWHAPSVQRYGRLTAKQPGATFPRTAWSPLRCAGLWSTTLALRGPARQQAWNDASLQGCAHAHGPTHILKTVTVTLSRCWGSGRRGGVQGLSGMARPTAGVPTSWSPLSRSTTPQQPGMSATLRIPLSPGRLGQNTHVSASGGLLLHGATPRANVCAGGAVGLGHPAERAPRPAEGRPRCRPHGRCCCVALD
jgi:hypothetical protein